MTTRVLIVEDDAIMAAHLHGAVTSMGYELAGMMSTGEEAVDRARELSPDVILMDIRLRGAMNGIEAARSIQATIEVPVIYITAYADEHLVEQAKLTGPYAYLVKPIRDKELHVAIEMALYKSMTDRRLSHLNRVLLAVRDVGKLIVRERDASVLLEDACRIVARTRGYLFVWIGRVDGGPALLSPIFRAGLDCDVLAAAVTVTQEDGTVLALHDLALRARQTAICDDAGDALARSLDGDRGLKRQAAAAAVPMLHGDRLYGVLNVYAEKAGYLDVDEVGLLEELAADLALGLRGIEDEAERRRAEETIRISEERLRSLYELSQKEFESEQELIDFALDEAVALTGSTIGYFHCLQGVRGPIPATSWSTEVHEICAADIGDHISTGAGGLWADAARTRNPVVHNDFAGITNRVGYPHGHPVLARHLCVPVLHGAVVVAVGGVANKPGPYDESDTLQLQHFWDDVWRMIVRRRAEDDRARLQAQLVQAQKLETVAAMTAGVAHDFNNLLTIMQMRAELASMKPHLDVAVLEDLRQIIATVGRAAGVSRRLLLFSRRGAVVCVPFDLNAAILDLVKLFGRLLGERIRIETDLDPTLPAIKGDVGSLDQVLMNLVLNARDAMPGGGVITICTGRSGEWVTLSVADTGTGMSAEIARRAFEPLFTTKEAGRGTGLGLSVTREIVLQHGGRIALETRPGKGSTFLISLPAASAEAGSETSCVDPKLLRGNGERILVVEDQEEIRVGVAEALRANGYKVLVAGDIGEALQTGRGVERGFDILFADLQLPDGDGLSLYDTLHTEFPDLKALFTTGHIELEDVAERLLERRLPCLRKPYAVPTVLQGLRDLLSPAGSGGECRP